MKNTILPTLLGVILVLLAPIAAIAADSTLIEFEIKDQFKNKHTHEELQDKVVLIVGHDRGGRKYKAPWAEALYDSLKPEVDSGRIMQVGYADTRGVPFFLKGWARRKVRKEEDTWMLLDWKGVLAKAYEFEKGKCNILVFDTQGVLRHHLAATEVQPVKLNRVIALLRSLLSSEKEPSN
ncbi:MAG: YtfJ family protein [candidate division Zixibacteria bacterium]|nr:YtfJ family protein [candidate division Zixibacteria bacterium]MDH3937756.1 YtfJ family protein [candidate division Zixibacteria bacterium]MDH4034943.1 YtfJ family protein [candidate division Zixibacteria bacterium]